MRFQKLLLTTLFFLTIDGRANGIHQLLKLEQVIGTSGQVPTCDPAATKFDSPLNCSTSSNIPLFQDEEILQLEMTSAYFELRQAKASNFEESQKEVERIIREEKGKKHKAEMELAGKGYPPLKVGVTIEPRGNYRLAMCDKKPILVELPEEFKKKGTIFNHAHDEIKIVRGCDSNDPLQQQKVLREYQSYKLLECFGLPHFKTRLFKAKFKKTNGEVEHDSFGFFIEPAKDMAQRCGEGAQVFTKDESLKKRDLSDPPSPTSVFQLILSGELLLEGDFDFDGVQNVVSHLMVTT